MAVSSAVKLPYDRLGPYEILRLLGAGGMGIVYAARQEHPHREVALKVLRWGEDARIARARFDREIELLGKLRHPGIAQIFESGITSTPDGERAWFAMELVDGAPIDEFAREHALTIDERIELFTRVCDAVQHAHARGIVHRDLKPSNILVEASPTGPQVKVLDFGLGCLIGPGDHTATVLTHPGLAIGTLQFMSPEQVLGDLDSIGITSDVYSLGVLLYLLLTGAHPLWSVMGSLPSAARAIVERDPRPLGKTAPGLRGDLDLIAAKAMHKEIGMRYQSASELALDLRRYQASEPIAARPPSAVYQMRKFARRHRGLVVGLALALFFLIAGILSTSAYAWIAHQESQRAVKSEDDALQENARLQYLAATSAWENRNLADLEQALDAIPEDRRGLEWRVLAAERDQQVTTLSETSLGRGDFSPDSGQLAWAIDEETIGVWDPATGRQTKNLRTRCLPQVQLVQFALGGKRLLRFGSGRLEIYRTDLDADPKLALEFDHVDAISPADERIAIARGGGNVTILDLDSLLQIKRFDVPGCVQEMAISPDGDLLALTRSADETLGTYTLEVRAIESGALVHEQSGDAWGVRWSDQGRLLVSLLSVPGSYRWQHYETIDSRTWQQLSADSSHIYLLPFSSRAHLATATESRTSCVIDLRDGHVIAERMTHLAAIREQVLSADESLLITSGMDRAARVWSTTTGRQIAAALGLPGEVSAIAIDSSSRWLVARDSRKRSLQLFDLEAVGHPELRGHDSYVYSLVYAPGGTVLVSASIDKSALCFWDSETGLLLARHGQVGASSLHMIDDGRRLLVCSSDEYKYGHCFVLDTLSGEAIATWPADREFMSGGGIALSQDQSRAIVCADEGFSLVDAHLQGPDHVYPGFGQVAAWFPDGKCVVLAWTRNGRACLQIANPSTLLSLRERELPMRRTSAIAVHPSGRELALGSGSGEILILDAVTLETRVALSGHTAMIHSLVYSPDGTRLYSGSADFTISAWSVAERRRIVCLRGHDGYVKSIAMRPDGQQLASGSGDMTIRLWDAQSIQDRHLARLTWHSLLQRETPRVDALLDLHADPWNAYQALRDDPKAPPDARRKALNLILARGEARRVAAGGASR